MDLPVFSHPESDLIYDNLLSHKCSVIHPKKNPLSGGPDSGFYGSSQKYYGIIRPGSLRLPTIRTSNREITIIPVALIMPIII
jgi:hypothetical protein